MKRIMIVWLAVVSLTFAVSCGGKENVKANSPANENHGTGTGYAMIFDNDEGLARDRALEDASRKLVENVLGNTVTGRSVVQDFQLVSSIIDSASSGIVKNVKVQKQERKDDTLIITIEGDVFPAAVEEAIRAALDNYGRPKFIVLVNESFEGTTNAPGMTVTELSMMDIMGSSGFGFVDSSTVTNLLKKDKTEMAKAMSGQIKGDEKLQSLIFDDTGAEVIIFGDVKTSDQSAAMKKISANMLSKRAIISLKAVDLYTGEILASVSADAAGLDIDAAVGSKKAIQNCLGSNKVLGRVDDGGKFEPGNFTSQITRKFVEAATRRPISLKISGIDTNEMIKFRDFLSQRVRGIKKVEVKGQQNGETRLEVLFSGKTVDLTDEFAAKGAASGYAITVVKSYPNKIQMTVKKTK